MGGRGKNHERGRHDIGTRKRERNTGGGATLTKPARSPRANQGRNQQEWHTKRKMKSRY